MNKKNKQTYSRNVRANTHFNKYQNLLQMRRHSYTEEINIL